MVEMRTLGDFATFKYGKMPDKKKLSEHGKYPVYSGYRYVGYYDEYNTEANQLIIVARGVGGTGDVKLTKERCYLTNLSISAEIDQNVALPEFLYYYYLPRNLRYLDSGSAQSQITISDLEKVVIPLPSLREQKVICEYLNALDHKIAINTEVNNNLLQQMESLYKAWFKDFVPFNGDCPADWKKADIYSIANIIYGAPFSSKLFNTDGDGMPIIRIRDLREQAFVTYTTEQHPKGHLIQPGDIVVGMDGEFRPYIWGNTAAWLNQRVCIFENKRPKGKAFILFTIKPLLYQIEQTQVATTVIHIGKKDYDAFEFLLPNENTLDQFDEITCLMIEQIVANCLENKRLSEMRDALLPKLMSGELNISDIDF